MLAKQLGVQRRHPMDMVCNVLLFSRTTPRSLPFCLLPSCSSICISSLLRDSFEFTHLFSFPHQGPKSGISSITTQSLNSLSLSPAHYHKINHAKTERHRLHKGPLRSSPSPILLSRRPFVTFKSYPTFKIQPKLFINIFLT